MEIFFSRDIDSTLCRLDADESAHCVKVMRHREGDEVHVIDGEGTLYRCRLVDASPKAAVAQVLAVEPDWGAHPYHLDMAVCPTKNNDRYEWFAEKATELGVDVVTPVIGDHSERRVFKTERLERILLSASKQSLKGAVPKVSDPLPLKDYILSLKDSSAIKLICCCYEGEEKRVSIFEALASGRRSSSATANARPRIAVLIGPEGDFSREEVALALECGFRPVHLGPSRLRTETAALSAVAAVYYFFCGEVAME